MSVENILDALGARVCYPVAQAFVGSNPTPRTSISEVELVLRFSTLGDRFHQQVKRWVAFAFEELNELGVAVQLNTSIARLLVTFTHCMVTV